MESHTFDDPVTADLVSRLIAQCRQLCETGAEGPIADTVQRHHTERGDRVQRIGNSLVVRAALGRPDDEAAGRPLVVLAGHLDVVAPTSADDDPHVATVDGMEVVVGRGSSDMKGGNVVAMRAFERVADGDVASDLDVALVLYAGEEGPAEGNELARVLDEADWLSDAALAIVLEPTDGEVQLGCLGGLHATLAVAGQQAHSARPWHGRNALTAAGTLLTAFDRMQPVEVRVGGVAYHDVWSLTQAVTPNGRNVIPATLNLNLNFRFSPSRGLDEAEGQLRTLVADLADQLDLDVTVEVTDRAPPAPPGVDLPMPQRFLDRVAAATAAKQAWTDVARFAQVGVPALNFGPGRTDQAHQRGEYVEVWQLRAASDALEAFLAPGTD